MHQRYTLFLTFWSIEIDYIFWKPSRVGLLRRWNLLRSHRSPWPRSLNKGTTDVAHEATRLRKNVFNEKTSFKKNNYPNMLLVAMEYTDMNTDHKHGIILEIAVKSEEQRPSKIKVFEPWWSKIGWIESIESEHFGIFTTSEVRHLAPNFFAWNTLKTHRPTLRDIDSAISNKTESNPIFIGMFQRNLISLQLPSLPSLRVAEQLVSSSLQCMEKSSLHLMCKLVQQFHSKQVDFFSLTDFEQH